MADAVRAREVRTGNPNKSHIEHDHRLPDLHGEEEAAKHAVNPSFPPPFPILAQGMEIKRDPPSAVPPPPTTHQSTAYHFGDILICSDRALTQGVVPGATLPVGPGVVRQAGTGLTNPSILPKAQGPNALLGHGPVDPPYPGILGVRSC